MPKLSVYLDSGRVSHELSEERITIGRAPDNMIQINDPSVSGRHAQLSLIGERYQLKDLASTNGTRVNSELVTDVFLRVGDRLRFGKVEARYETDATGAAQPLPDAAEIEARPAETSEKPADFANASPFPHRPKEKDPVATAILATGALALLAFFISLIGLWQIHGPK
ncbi:MAG TPA: FHA domain-containing protein [Chthoniobacterales bacterium]|jgi:pSer/pThr/pTyr-binding forkhead associated (FHA) protein